MRKELTHWLNTVTGGDSWRTIAEKLGTTHATIQRRLQDNTATAICDLAAAYGANPLGGLIAANIVTQIDIDTYARTVTIDDYTDLELAQAIVSRLENVQHPTLESVTEFPSPNVTHLPYAADNSDTEPEPGDDDYHDGP